jgi:DNA-binding MarR family transcriptional regulator
MSRPGLEHEQTERVDAARVDDLIERFWDLVNAADELGRHLARALGLHVTDATAVVEVLRAEDAGDPLTPVRLAGKIGLTSGATSLLLNRLEEAGYVDRRRGHADRRRVTLHVTEAVHEPLKAFQDPVREDFQRVLASRSSTDLDVVEGVLDALRDAVDAHHRRYGS